MPSLTRPTIIRHVLAGRRVPAGTPGAKKVREKSRYWYAVGVPGHPAKKRVPLRVADKSAAERLLAELVRRAERGLAGVPDADAAATPFAELLPRFARDVAAGLASRGRAKRRPSPDQVDVVVARVRDALAGCGFASPADLTPDAPTKLVEYLARRLGKPVVCRREAAMKSADSGLSARTAEHVVAAMRRFAWWLSSRAKVPVPADLFDRVPGFDPESNRVHVRRDATPAELAALLAATRTARTLAGLTGEDRYFLYLTAFTTGFRSKELSSLTAAAFDWSAGVVSLRRSDSKNKRGAAQPLPASVAAELRPWAAARTGPLWPGPWAAKAARTLREDLKAAGVAYRLDTPGGPKVLDFHGLRHTFVSLLASAGVGPKELQELARHSDPRLTLGVYTHATAGRLAEAVGKLPLPGAEFSPLAALSRDQVETLVAVLAAALLAVAFPVAPGLARNGP